MEFKLSQPRLRELAQLEQAAGCDISAGGEWDHSLAKNLVQGNQPGESTSRLCFEIYLDQVGQYRWRCKDSSGRIIAGSTQGYLNPSECEAEIRQVQQFAPQARIVA